MQTLSKKYALPFRVNKPHSLKPLTLIFVSLTLAASLVTQTAGATEPTATPEFVNSFGVGAADGSSTGPGMLNQPTDVAVDSSGNVYVADAANSRI